MPRRRTEQPHRRARRDDDLRRRPPTKRGRPIVLIVCEGVETELRYFQAMRRRQGLISVSIEVVPSGRQSERLVEQAVDLRQRRARQPDTLPYEFVILGAGFDTRAYRLSPEAHVRCFEIDEPKTQAFKRAMLKQAGIDTSRVTFVPADFAQEDWFEKLVEAGFAPDKRSFFTWESVTMYLEREAVEGTLRTIARTAPAQSSPSTTSRPS